MMFAAGLIIGIAIGGIVAVVIMFFFAAINRGEKKDHE